MIAALWVVVGCLWGMVVIQRQSIRDLARIAGRHRAAIEALMRTTTTGTIEPSKPRAPTWTTLSTDGE